jgi:Tol biopolymer transport system component/DNA-binding winged helix-turn-helix (wHTH) protein
MRDETGRSGLPIDLAATADFRLAGLLVSPSTREVSRDGAREMLEPRVMQVLVALFQGDGRVISRDELIARCWEGRIVGEDAINRAIGRLRRLSEADGEASFGIETVPRVGYRLTAKDAPAAAEEAAPAVTSLSQAPSSPSAQSIALPPPVSRRPWLFWVAGVGLILIAGMAATWLFWPDRHWTVESSRPFISSLALEGEPAFSPDGRMLAYSAGPDLLSRKIYVRNVAGGDPIRVTNDPYDDVSPTWSPDGTRIAYVAVKPGEPCRIMVVSVPAGEARQVGRCVEMQTSSVSWQPGTSFLYYMDHIAPPDAPAPGESVPAYLLRFTDIVMRLDLDSGARMTVPKDPTNTILSMRRVQCSPDGKSLLFLGAESASTDVLRIRDLASGRERVLGKIVIGGSAAWSEDSRSVLIAKASGLGSDITAHPIDGAAPYSVYAAAVNVSHLAAGKGGVLALETDPRRQNLARALSVPAAQPEIIDAANGKSWSPTFAPDGTLAFLSNRSGSNAVWVMKPGAAPAPLYDGGLSPLFRIAYSPDGKYIAMPVAKEDGLTITILTADGATVSSFSSPTFGFGAPTWTPDSKEVIYFDRRTLAYVRVDVANPSRRRLAAPELWAAVFYHGGRTYATRPYKRGYWQLGKEPKLVTTKYPLSWEPPPAVLGDDLLVPDFDAAGGPRILAQPLSGGADRVLAYAPGARAQFGILESGMAANLKTGEIVYVAAVQSDTNIDLLTLAKR